jgi:MtN3 and saliva related transmembrane protein
MATFLGYAAAGWAIVMAFAPLLQLRRVVRRGSADDVSLGYLAVLLLGFALWVAYGLARGDAALVVPNCVALVVASGTCAVIAGVRRRSDASQRPGGSP